MNPISIAESALGGSIVELLKLATQDRNNFEQVFRKSLAKQLKARNKNTAIIDQAIDTLLTDPEIQGWLSSPQLPDGLPLLKSLAGKLKLDVLFLQDFFLAFEITIVGNDRLNKILQNRRAASRTQDVRDILRALSGLQTEAQSQHDLAAIRRYREKIRQRFSTIALFVEKRATADAETSLSRMADIERGFVPVSLCDCRERYFIEKPMVLLLDGLDEIEGAATNEKTGASRARQQLSHDEASGDEQIVLDFPFR